jgi:hypothetical protein
MPDGFLEQVGTIIGLFGVWLDRVALAEAVAVPAEGLPVPTR